ncbi:hypothetical protein U9M48_001289 [Paspalum notatum var. saurae]|uniref:Uncharacterized protein n=1 Tax=Paspalum notatum var. saurae TaxID=547442 RepID=A0AAQ3PN86_PASNO
MFQDFARKSHGGTYHNTPHSDVGNSLLKYFAKVLGILRDVSLEVHPGNYRVTPGGHGSFTIHFGDLARKEHRRIIAVVQLPAVLNNEKAKTVMDVDCSYRYVYGTEQCHHDHLIIWSMISIVSFICHDVVSFMPVCRSIGLPKARESTSSLKIEMARDRNV